MMPSQQFVMQLVSIGVCQDYMLWAHDDVKDEVNDYVKEQVKDMDKGQCRGQG